MAFIFIFIDLPPNWVLLLQERFLGSFLSGSVLGFPLEPGQDVWWSSMWKGEEGRQPGMTPTPILSHTLPGASHSHSGRRGFSVFHIVLSRPRAWLSVTFRGRQRAFPLSQTKKVTDPDFPCGRKKRLRESRSEVKRIQSLIERHWGWLGDPSDSEISLRARHQGSL